jgi:hypothetical protein
MKRLWMAKGVAASLASVALLATAGDALAAPCSGITNKVVISGSTAIQSVIAALGTVVGTSASPITIVYYGPGSCAGLTDVAGSPDKAATWTTYLNGVTGTCDGDSINGLAVDIGVSDVYPATCASAGQFTMPASGFADFPGPIQAMTFVVPSGSSEHSISAEAAFAILGYAGTGMYDVGPWTATPNTSTTNLFIRSTTSGTLQMIASEIGLAGSKWKGTAESGSGAVVTAVNAATPPSAGLGIVAAQSAQSATTPPRILAFQAKGQECGYLPDSSSTTLDKINVREGRYDIWGPEHFYTAVDGSGVPTSANAKAVTDAISLASVSASSKAVIAAEISAGVVPQCAMKVSRTEEVGAEASFQPTGDCSCFFDATVPPMTAPTTCHACTVDMDCADAGTATHCNYGYCEVQ